MSVGLPSDNSRRQISQTQLRRQKHKKADRTAGRKRPRLHDVDVLAAGDADDAAVAELQAEVCVTEAAEEEVAPDSVTEQAAMPATSERIVDEDCCAECGLPEPPSTVSHSKFIDWVDCHTCHYWYHTCCVKTQLKKKSKQFVCSRC